MTERRRIVEVDTEEVTQAVVNVAIQWKGLVVETNDVVRVQFHFDEASREVRATVIADSGGNGVAS